MRKLWPLLVIGLVVTTLYRHVTRDPAREDYDDLEIPATAPDPATLQVEQDANDSQRFHCDGRVYCSQMTSCAEATYFLRHCPGVKMDGEGDGVPCEKQWCGRH